MSASARMYSRHADGTPTATVSVVICTRDRPKTIRQAVQSVLGNDYSGFDLTIVDQSSDAQTELALSDTLADPRVTYLHTDQTGLSRAYNTGIRASAGEYLAFTDDDCIVPTGWITSIAAALDEDPEADLLYGQVISAHTDSESVRLTPTLTFRRARRLSKHSGFQVFGMGANFAARRRLFSQVGYFDEALGGGGPLRSSQDFDLAYRVYRGGSVILLRPDVVVRHDGRRESAEWPSLLEGYGIGDGAFYAKHIRCMDAFALRLFARRVVSVTSRHLLRTTRTRTWYVDPYIRGLIKGVRASAAFEVDRRTRLYEA